jgi:hypothetical protein
MSNVNMSAKSKLASIDQIKKPIKGPGLTAPGIIILQSLFILIIETFEYAIGKIGTLTGIALLLSIAGGIYLGRKGTEFINAVNPPLALFGATVIVLCTLGGVGLHIARLGLDLVTTLAALAPYLAIGALISWGNYIAKSRAARAE